MTPPIGSHVERADPLGGALSRNAEVIQINLTSPRSWQAPRRRGDEEQLAASGMDIFVHSPYLVNAASVRAEQREKSRRCLEEQSRAAAEIGAVGLVVHGGHPTGGGTVADGIDGWLEVLDGAELPCRILIENTAGGSAAVARHLDALEKLFAAIRGAGHDVGFVLDTCHAHAGGIELDGVVERLIGCVGAIDLVHVNDSKDSAGCGRDRHETLGQGLIPQGLIAEIVGAANAPAVVETPGEAQDQASDIAWLRQRLS